MIFTKHDTRLILDGRKTTTRRPVKPGKSCPWKPGHDYAIQRGNLTADERIEITHVHVESLARIDFAAVRAEGYKTTASFADAWMGQHDTYWPPTEPCFTCDGDGTTDCDTCWDGPVRVHDLRAHPCKTCSGTGEQFADLTDQDILDHFHAQHANTTVWVLTFRLADVSSYLAHPIPGRQGDYTRNRLRALDDLEVTNTDQLHHHWRTDSDRRHAEAESPQQRAARLANRAKRAA